MLSMKKTIFLVAARTIFGSFPEGVYVLHCFQKKTRQTALRDIEFSAESF